MRYNIKGDLAAGVGYLNINKVSIGNGFLQCWRDPDTIIANSPGSDGVFRLYQYRRSNNWQQELLDDRGATRGGGGNGNYAIFLATQPTKTVYGQFNGNNYPPNTFPWMGLSILDGSQDGRLLFISEDFQSMIVVAPDGSTQTFFTGPHVNISNVRLVDGGFVYMDESHSKAMMLQQGSNQPVPVACVDAAFDPTSFVYNGQRWLFYHNDYTYLQLSGSTKGYRFDPSYGPDVFVDSNGMAHVALTYSPGEAADTITLVPPFKLGEGMIELVVPPIPVPIPPIPPTPIPIPPTPVPIPPTPIPIPPPTGVKMKTDLVITQVLPTFDVTEVPHPDKQGLVALKTPAGKFKSLTPDGSWQPDADVAGAWERFFPFGGGWYAYREDTGKLFVITTRVPQIPYMK